MRHIPRFYTETELDISEGQRVFLSPDQIHHAVNVLRLTVGDVVRVFNSECGEWNCKIANIKKGYAEAVSLFRKNKPEEGSVIACSLINPKRFDFFLEKATELGVSEIIPIVSRYTQYQEINVQKAKQKIILACEQSGRFSIPILKEITKIDFFLKKYTADYQILVGNIGGFSIKSMSSFKKECIFLIGPEGGFSNEEYNLFDVYKNVVKVSLGDNILRTETAAIAFASIWRNYFF
jgi:16S rRNA (uracil1498-N3)-methyltransferase